MGILKSLAGVARTVAPFVGGPAGLAMGIGGGLVGSMAGRRRRGRPKMSDEEKLEGYRTSGRKALGESMRGLESDMMPEFQRELQGIRESNRRRGISNGELATSYEGDAASAFQRNIANALARGSMEVENTALDRLYGEKDRALAERNAKRAGRGNLLSSLAGAVGTGVGAYYGRKAG